MNKGISFYFGFNVKPELRAKKIKEAGFDSIITSADKRFNKQNGKISKQVKLFKKYNLKLSSLHMTYNNDELPYFWEEGKEGEKLKKNLIKDVKIAKKYGFSCVVVHLFGKYSNVGEKRLKEVLKVCEKTEIPLAIENIDCQNVFLETFKNISSPYLKFCYDSGHNNIFDKDFDYLNQFEDKLIALHLHDNDGESDLHTVSKISGTIDWDRVAQGLAGHSNISLDYELLNKKGNDLTAEQYLNEAYKQACDLEKRIEAYYNKDK